MPPRQSSNVFNSLFIFDNQALEIGGNPVFSFFLWLAAFFYKDKWISLVY